MQHIDIQRLQITSTKTRIKTRRYISLLDHEYLGFRLHPLKQGLRLIGLDVRQILKPPSDYIH